MRLPLNRKQNCSWTVACTHRLLAPLLSLVLLGTTTCEVSPTQTPSSPSFFDAVDASIPLDDPLTLVDGGSDAGGEVDEETDSGEAHGGPSDADASWGDGAQDGGDAGEDDGCIWFGPNAGNCSDGGADGDSGTEASLDGSSEGDEEDGGADGDAGGEEEDSDGEFEPVEWSFCETIYTAPPQETATLKDPVLTGVSGLVASRKNKGILWVHNDYQGPARAFAIDAATGKTVAVLSAPNDVEKASNVEDIALGRCPWALQQREISQEASDTPPTAYDDAPCLYLADTGDNLKVREDLAIYVMEEPDLEALGVLVAASEPLQIQASEVWRIPITYPEEKCDSEAFVVEPDGSAFYVIEKVDALHAQLFEAKGPFSDGIGMELSFVGRLDAHPLMLANVNITPTFGLMMTGADLHPSRQRLLIRTYLGTFEYAFETEDWPREMPDKKEMSAIWGPLSEGQGEAVAYDASGTSIWTISEDKNQQPGQGIHWYPCQPK